MHRLEHDFHRKVDPEKTTGEDEKKNPKTQKEHKTKVCIKVLRVFA